MSSKKPVFWLHSYDNHIKYFPGNASDHAAVFSNVSSERICHTCCHFFTSQNIVDFEGTETLGNDLLNFL
jgi:hypothetical protein